MKWLLLALLTESAVAAADPGPACPWGSFRDLNQPRPPRASQNAKKADLKSTGGWTDHDWCESGFCLYSNTWSRGGEGMVAITAPSNLESLAKLGHAMNALPEFKGNSTWDRVRVEKMPGKGLGVVAGRKINKGESIMAQPPVLLAEAGFMSGVAVEDRDALLEFALYQLPGATRKLFLGQMGHLGGHRVADRIFTNGYNVQLPGREGVHWGLYPRVSRINHECRPNLMYHVDGGTLLHRTVAVRPIEPGQELTVTYLDPLQTREARRARAQRSWGFRCNCAQCRAFDSEGSDRRLERIGAIQTLLRDPGAPGSMEMAEALIRAYEEERLESRLAEPLMLAARTASGLGRSGNAKKYAKLAVKQCVMQWGEGGSAQDMRNLARNPVTHESWKNRVGRKG